MKKDFTQIPNILIKDPNISDAEFRTYVVLLSFKYGERGRVFPSYNTIAKIRYKSEKSIQCHIRALTDYGVMSHSRRGFNKTNEYFFNENDYSYIDEQEPKEINDTYIWKQSGSGTGEILHTNNTEINNTKMKNTESCTSPTFSENNSNETEENIEDAREKCREVLRKKGVLKK